MALINYLNAFNGALGGLILPVRWALDILC
jgi:hypothetical protein